MLVHVLIQWCTYYAMLDLKHTAHHVHADAATSLTPGFQRLNTAATPASSVSSGVGGGGGGRRGGAASAAAPALAAATATGKGRGGASNNRGASAMVLETPPPSSSASSLDGGSSGGGALRPEALARKLRRLAGEALDKVCAGTVCMGIHAYRMSDISINTCNRHPSTQRLHARAAFYADKLVTLGHPANHGPQGRSVGRSVSVGYSASS